MFDIAPDHAIGLLAGLLTLPVAALVLRFQRGWSAASGTVQAAAVLMAATGVVHLALIGPHRTEPVTELLFLVNGVAFIGLAASVGWRPWRFASSALLVATILGYLIYIGIGLEGPDQVGVATKLVELVALGLVLVPVGGEPKKSRRGLRWTALGVVLPMLTVMTASTAWVVSFARPDARHVHDGALLQATNALPTQEQREAANRLYAETKAAILPYQDSRKAFVAGYRPGDPSNMPSTHWMNQAYVNAGYVMDPRRPQGLVYANSKHGPVLLGAMFEMKNLGQFGSDPGGPLTAWHQHENICFTPFGFEFSFMTPFATCPVGAIDISVSPMLHVWIVDNPKGGPFAVDIDDEVVKAIDRA